MSDQATLDAYGVLIEPATLKIQRLLPGPIERVWAYLTESDLRRQWLAAGEMQAKADTDFSLTWRNDELTDPPGHRPPGFDSEHTLQSRITEIDPPRKLAFTWGTTGGVSFELEPKGGEVLLTVIHRRIPEQKMLRNVSAGWHSHLDLLADRLAGRKSAPFWEHMVALQGDYAKRLG